LQIIANHCKSLQIIAKPYKSLQNITNHYKSLQIITNHSKTLQIVSKHCKSLQHRNGPLHFWLNHDGKAERARLRDRGKPKQKSV
jgi:hypothetical protein